MLNNGEMRDRIAKIPDEREKKVACLLSDMGFDFVDANVVRQNYPEPIIGELDLIFQSGDVLLLVEVGTGRHKISDKKWDFFSKWADESNLKALKRQCNLQCQKTIRAYFDLRPEPENLGWVEMADIAKPGSMNKIYYEGDFDRLAERVERGDWSKDDFLTDFC